MVCPGSPMSVVQRVRLWAMQAITVQALLAAELAGGEMRERLVFEVADRQLDDGVLAVLGLDYLQRVGAVGEEREVAPVGPQLGLRAEQARAPDDHPLATQGGLGDLRLPVLGVLIEGL